MNCPNCDRLLMFYPGFRGTRESPPEPPCFHCRRCEFSCAVAGTDDDGQPIPDVSEVIFEGNTL